jgi:hypothetical protein
MITYQIDRAAHIVTIRVAERLRVLDVSGFMEQLFLDPQFDASFDFVAIVAAAAMAPDIIARNALAELLLNWRKLHASSKWALVLPGPAWMRIATQLIDVYELDARNVRCVTDEPAALEWFHSPAAISSAHA